MRSAGRMAAVWLAVALGAAQVGVGGERWSYLDLVKRLTDLEALAVLPPPGEKCQQWSSYDRASKYDEKTGKYVRWDANGDGNGIIRREADKEVFAEMEGPGVIEEEMAVFTLGWLFVSVVAAAPAFGSDDWKAGEPYVVRRAAGAVTVDQKPHPEQWKNAMVIRGFFAAKSNSPAQSRTEAMMLWDEEHLYVQAVATDADLRGRFKERTDPLWEEDVVELFLKPREDQPGYYEFEVNPIGTVMALKIDERRDKKTIKERSAWETGIASAVQAVGTVNDSGDTDGFYRVILAIPWKSLAHAGGRPPKAGDAWRFTFARYDYSKVYKKAEESNSAPMTTDDWHRFEQYSLLRFAD